MKKILQNIDDSFSQFFSFSKSERNGVLIAVILIIMLFSGLMLSEKPPLNNVYLSNLDSISDSLSRNYYENKIKPKYRDTVYLHPNGKRVESKKSVYIGINQADSSALCSVKGVGRVIANSIMEHRTRLGGFVKLTQLREVYGITDKNFEAISKQFYVDSAVIQKIDINFAAANELSNHPYISRNMAQRIVKGRKLKGGWNNLRELIDNDILLPKEAQLVAPYLVFRDSL